MGFYCHIGTQHEEIKCMCSSEALFFFPPELEGSGLGGTEAIKPRCLGCHGGLGIWGCALSQALSRAQTL